MKTKKRLSVLIFFLVVLFPPTVFSLVISGSSGSDTYTSDSAQGSIAQRDLSSASGHSGIVFSWGGPLADATGSSGTNAYLLTIGPDFSDPEVAPPPPEEAAAVVAESHIPSSGGGGGGSSSRDSYGLTEGDKITVLINAQSHTISIDKVLEDAAVLTIESLPQTITIRVGETKEIDFEDDGIADMAITLDAVSELRRVTITVEDLTVKKEEQEQQTETEETPTPLEKITGAINGLDTEKLQALQEETQIAARTMTTYVLGINLLLGVLLGALFVAKHIQKQRLFSFVHQQSKQERIKQELQKVQHYAAQALQANISFQKVKKTLLTAGWHEYEIDQILVEEMLKSDRLNRFR